MLPFGQFVKILYKQKSLKENKSENYLLTNNLKIIWASTDILIKEEKKKKILFSPCERCFIDIQNHKSESEPQISRSLSQFLKNESLKSSGWP